MTPTITFHVPDMTCNHCVKTITAAIQNIAPDMKFTIDLPNRQLTISNTNNLLQLEDAIKNAGFTPQRL